MSESAVLYLIAGSLNFGLTLWGFDTGLDTAVQASIAAFSFGMFYLEARR